MICGTINPPDSSTTLNFQAKGPSASCNGNSVIYHNFFKHKENFIPWKNSTAPQLAMKTIKVRFQIAVPPNNGTKRNFEPADTPLLNTLIEWFNNTSADIDVPHKPKPTCIDGVCHIKNMNIRMEQAGPPIFFNFADTSYSSGNFNNYLVDKDSVLNIFFVYYNGSFLWDGIANGSVKSVTHGNEHNPNAFMSSNNHFVLNYRRFSQPDYGLWGTLITLRHELNHMFRLGHLFNSNFIETCDTTNIDYLSDALNPPINNQCLHDDSWNPACDISHPDYYNHYCDNNNMAKRGHNYMSPMQMGIIHREAHMGLMARYMYPTQAPDLNPWLISSNQTWDFGIRMYQNIIVKAGNTLTIKCEVQMPPNGRIIVEKGAKLVVDGGPITSYHPKVSWSGIELFGDINATPIASNQGSFEMKNNAIIEHAKIGVQDHLTNVWNGGDIINVTNSTFKDCWRGVGLNHYPNYVRGNSCRFIGVKFITQNPNAAANATIDSVGQFACFNQNGILIEDCHFTNYITLNNLDIKKSSYAIYGVNAGFRVQNSTFKGYLTGITTTTHDNSPAYAAKVFYNTFDSLGTGIMFASNFGNAQNNTFNNLIGYNYSNGLMAYYREGDAIYMDHASGITIHHNTIYNSNAFPIRGITSNSTRLYGSRVINNDINDARLGVITQRSNPTLDILCNNFKAGFSNIVVNPESNHPIFTLKDQGNECHDIIGYRAGNRFDGASFTNIANFLTSPWRYYYKRSVPDTEPSVFFTAHNPENGCEGNEQNSLCNKFSEIVPLTPPEYYDWINSHAGGPFSNMGLHKLALVMQGFSETGDKSGLMSFLYSLNDNESNKMLLPLLLDSKSYIRFDTLLNGITFDDSLERHSFVDYYNLLKQISVDERQIWDLKDYERLLLDNIASEDYEHASLAKAWKEFAFKEGWHHYQEQGDVKSTIAHQLNLKTPLSNSKLHDAIPNPMYLNSMIKVTLHSNDVHQAMLVIRNIMGTTIATYPLKEGDNEIIVQLDQVPAGVYTYSLQSNGKILATKRLAIIQ